MLSSTLEAWAHAASSMPPFFWIGMAMVLGALVGSFFNVVVYRFPIGLSVIWPPSRCPVCERGIRPLENIPVLSWIFLRGRCAGCQTRISLEYPLVEATTSLTAGLLTAYLVFYMPLAPWDFRIGLLYLGLVSIPITLIDIRHYLIPDMLDLTGLVLGLALAFLPGGLTPLDSFLGAAISGGFLWSVGFVAERLLKKEAMGLGDVKLIAMCGALFGLGDTMLGLLFASFLGTLVGLPLLWLGRLGETKHLPFGPFICAGVLLSVMAGSPLVNAYWNLWGL